MKVVIIGSGNVAHVLCALIQKAGHQITQIISRNIDHAKELAAKYDAQSGKLLDENFADADIYIIAVTDAALESGEMIKGLQNKLIVHTAGSVSKEVLKITALSFADTFKGNSSYSCYPVFNRR